MDPNDVCSDSFFKKSRKIQSADPLKGAGIVEIVPIPGRLTDQYKFGLADLGSELAHYRVIISRGMN